MQYLFYSPYLGQRLNYYDSLKFLLHLSFPNILLALLLFAKMIQNLH